MKTITFSSENPEDLAKFAEKIKSLYPNAKLQGTTLIFTDDSAVPVLNFQDKFDGPDGLITNEWSFWNPNDPRGVKSDIWQMDSGSLFRKSNQGWTGNPDDKSSASDPLSKSWNNSAIFRLVTKRRDFLNASVEFALTNNGYVATPSTPAVAWDGVHVFLRYQSEFSLYYASVNRRDNTISIKKKNPGGPSNQGTYWIGKVVPFKVLLGTTQIFTVVIKDNGANVDFTVYNNGKLILSDTDSGSGWTTDVAGQVQGAPIKLPGCVGLRIDNANVFFNDFTVSAP